MKKTSQTLEMTLTVIILLTIGYIIAKTFIYLAETAGKAAVIQCIKEKSCTPYIPPKQQMQAIVRRHFTTTNEEYAANCLPPKLNVSAKQIEQFLKKDEITLHLN